MEAKPAAAVDSGHIEQSDDVCGGKPRVAGTRIRVWDVHFWRDLRGMTPEEIVAEFPQLSVADVHAALAYYLDHREDIERPPDDPRHPRRHAPAPADAATHEALRRVQFVMQRHKEADPALLRNNLGKALNALGLKTPISF